MEVPSHVEHEQTEPSCFDPNRPIMDQILRIVAPGLIYDGSQEQAERRIVERQIDELTAQELGH